VYQAYVETGGLFSTKIKKYFHQKSKEETLTGRWQMAGPVKKRSILDRLLLISSTIDSFNIIPSLTMCLGAGGNDLFGPLCCQLYRFQVPMTFT
jgi:hypothetical protein